MVGIKRTSADNLNIMLRTKGRVIPNVEIYWNGGRSLNAQNKADIIYDSSSFGKTKVLPKQ